MSVKLTHQLKEENVKYTSNNFWLVSYAGFFFKSTQNYFNLSAAVALLIVYKVENQYSI